MTTRTMADYPLTEIILPMNAKEEKKDAKLDALFDDPNYISEEKYDGVRELAIGGRFFSRKISDIDGLPVEKTDRVPNLHELLKPFPNLILDGELYYPGCTSAEVTSIIGAKPEKAIARQQELGWLKYIVFDILRDMDGNWLIDKPWYERRKILENTINHIAEMTVITDFDFFIGLSKVEYANKRGLLGKVFERGGEGIMLKNINGLYMPDKRPANNWVKVKKVLTADVVVMGFEDAVKEYTGDYPEAWQYWEVTNESRPGWKGRCFVEEGFGEQAGQWAFTALSKDGVTYNTYTPVTRLYYNGWVGAIKFGQYEYEGEAEGDFGGSVPVMELVELGQCSGLTDALREEIKANPDSFIGRVMEIKAMERTKDGFFRHPVYKGWRDDKNAKDCVINN